MIEIIKSIAIKEIEEQSFELTKQYLSVNKLVYIDEKPQIDDVIINEDDQSATVYFPISNEAYYFVIYLDILPEIRVRFMGMNAGNRVYLVVSSEKINLEILLKDTGIAPTHVWRKGTQFPNRNISRFYENSGFILELQSTNRAGEVEEKLSNLLDKLETFNLHSIIKTKEINKIIQVTYYGYKDQMNGINLSPKNIARVSELDAYLDIDLYASGPNLE